MADRPATILIVGQPKTGTSALFFKIKNSISGDNQCLFEPGEDELGSPKVWDRPAGQTLLAKVVLLNDARRHEYIGRFEKTIFIVRDPRDRFVSAILYSARDSNYFADDEKVQDLLRLLEKKENDPKAVPLVDIWRLCIELEGRTSYDKWVENLPRSLDFVAQFHTRHSGLFVFKYEDLIDGNLTRLEDYLGMPLKGDARVSGEYSRVERTKGYGNWRDWFTESDVALLRPACEAYMERFGYANEWTLNVSPAVLPRHASEYVRKLINQRRAESGHPQLI